MPIAITRAVSARLADCELTHLPRLPIDAGRARRQHRAYEAALERAGARVRRLPALDELPDAVFVEDTAVVLDEVAILAVPGADSRAAEVPGIRAALADHRPLESLVPPARLDGGDVLRIGRTLYVGRSGRTNAEAVEQLRRIVEPRGYAVVPVPVTGCLHLKTGCTHAGDDVLVANPAWVDLAPFRGLDILAVAEEEPWAANVLRIGDTLLAAAGFPRTRERLERRGFRVVEVDIGEFHKAEAGLTCLSLIVPGQGDV